MAYESFAGERITGAPGRPFPMRGGGIPTTDIPNLPKADLSMPTANYPSIPTIRHQEMSLGGQDWGRRAAQLKQEDLPSSFLSGIKRQTAAAGEGEMAMGRAVSKGSAQLGGAMVELGGHLNSLQEHLQNESQQMAEQKEENSYNVFKNNFLARAEKEGITPDHYQEEFWKNEGKDYRNSVDGILQSTPGGFLGMGKMGLSDKLAARVASREAGFQAFTAGEEVKYVHKGNEDAYQFGYSGAMADNRFDDAREAVSRGLQAKVIREGEYDAKMQEIDRKERGVFADNITNGPHPEIARDEAKIILDTPEGETPKGLTMFKGMDKTEARRVHDNAEKAIVERQKAGLASLIDKGQKAEWGEERMRKEGKTAGLDQKSIDSAVDAVTKSRPRKDGLSADAMQKVSEVDLKGSPKEAFKNYQDTYQFILDNTDEKTQKKLISELDKKWEKRDDLDSVQDVEAKDTVQMIKSWYPSTKEEWEKWDKAYNGPSEFKEREKEKLNRERMELLQSAAKYQDDNPEFKNGELHQYIVDKHTPKLQEDAKNAVNVAPSAATEPVDTRRPYYGASGVQPGPPKPGQGSVPDKITPEDIDARRKAWEKAPPASAPGYSYTTQPPAEQPPPVGTSGAPTPMTPKIQKFSPTQEGDLTATQMPPGKLLPSKGLEQESVPGAKWATPVHGYTPSPTPAGGVPRVAAPTSEVPPPGEYPAESPAQTVQPASKAPYPAGTPIRIKATAYVPGAGGMEGKNEVASRRGPAYTFEQYATGDVPWVSVAMDSKSSLQGQFLTNDAYPGVVFKVEDTGKAFKGAGDSRIDIAFSDKGKATGFAARGEEFKVVSQDVASRMSGGPRGTAPSVTARPTETAAAGPIKITNRAKELDLPAMKRPRDTSNIHKIVIHGDVLTDVNKLIEVQRSSDLGYNYYIDLNGNITEAVDPGHMAQHIYHQNSDSLGIILVGADNGKEPTAAQVASAKQLIKKLSAEFHIKPENVQGHGERQSNRHELEGGTWLKAARKNGFA